MLKKTRKWDVRCSDELKDWRTELRGRPYYWKVNREQAQGLVNSLCKAYNVKPCKIMPNDPPADFGKCYAVYQCGAMWIHARAHVKSVFHEFYHHLDFSTKHKYNSNDNRGGESSYAWQFADRLWNLLKTLTDKKRSNTMSKKIERTKKVSNKKATKNTVKINKDQTIKILTKNNPFKKGSSRSKRFQSLKSGMTVAETLKKVKRGFLRFVVGKKLVAVK